MPTALILVWHPEKCLPRVACTFQGKEGQIILDQIRTVDKARLVRKLGQVKKATRSEVLDVLAEMFADGRS